MAGTFGALLLTRPMTSMLYQMRPAGPAAFGAAALLLAGVALLASRLPARRATSIEPTSALRAN